MFLYYIINIRINIQSDVCLTVIIYEQSLGSVAVSETFKAQE